MSDDLRLILAMDVLDTDQAEELARMSEGKVRAIKVNWPLLMINGTEIIGRLSKYANVICDLKIADIPNTNRLITEKVKEAGAWGVISHIFPGKDSLEAVYKAAGSMNVLGVVAMTHPGSHEFMLQQRHGFLRIAKEVGIYGIIAPGNDYALTSELKKEAGNLKIVSPGVGAQGGKASEAIRSGSDYIIVGRHIYQSGDPVDKIDELNREIKEVI